jgi:hypothetical protein
MVLQSPYQNLFASFMCIAITGPYSTDAKNSVTFFLALLGLLTSYSTNACFLININIKLGSRLKNFSLESFTFEYGRVWKLQYTRTLYKYAMENVG